MDKGYRLGLITPELYRDFLKEKNDIHAVLAGEPRELSARARVSVQAEQKYAPYIEREQREIAKVRKYQELKIPASFVFKELPGLSIELQQKLERYRPETIAQAGRISGMTPAAVSLLIWKINAEYRL
jgi:tRNA uridine 5-carboxymethylaminomethyl modification enzyme